MLRLPPPIGIWSMFSWPTRYAGCRLAKLPGFPLPPHSALRCDLSPWILLLGYHSVPRRA